jgi:hypothetical protein
MDMGYNHHCRMYNKFYGWLISVATPVSFQFSLSICDNRHKNSTHDGSTSHNLAGLSNFGRFRYRVVENSVFPRRTAVKQRLLIFFCILLALTFLKWIHKRQFFFFADV